VCVPKSFRASEEVQRFAVAAVRLLLRGASLLEYSIVTGRGLLAGNGARQPGLQTCRGGHEGKAAPQIVLLGAYLYVAFISFVTAKILSNISTVFHVSVCFCLCGG